MWSKSLVQSTLCVSYRGRFLKSQQTEENGKIHEESRMAGSCTNLHLSGRDYVGLRKPARIDHTKL